MSRNRIILVTIGIMLSLFLASMEATVVGQLGGLEHYSWVFSAYMLASTASGLNPELVSQLLEPSSAIQTVLDEGPRLALANAIHLVFVIALAAAAPVSAD